MKRFYEEYFLKRILNYDYDVKLCYAFVNVSTHQNDQSNNLDITT